MNVVLVCDLSPRRPIAGRFHVHSGGCFRLDRSRGESIVTAGDEPLVAAPEGTTTAGSASNGGHSRVYSKAPPKRVLPRMTTRTREYLWYETTRATKTSLHVDRNAVTGFAERYEPVGCRPQRR
jgi:hypothetical protein